MVLSGFFIAPCNYRVIATIVKHLAEPIVGIAHSISADQKFVVWIAPHDPFIGDFNRDRLDVRGVITKEIRRECEVQT